MSNSSSRNESIKTTISLLAGADLSSSENLFVKLDSSGDAVLAGNSELAIGVLQCGAVSGGAVSVAVIGAGNISRVIASAAITSGDLIGVTADGEAVTASSGDHEMGQALTSAAADQDYVVVLLGFSGVTA